ncbi:hypothetical protein U1Q18_004613 [Sarracenia purpurea var. burkii]
MASSNRDWAWLPINILDSIVEKLNQFSNYMQFSAVCKQWRRAALEDNGLQKQRLSILKTCRNKLPMLMIQTEENQGKKRHLFSVTEGITYELELPFPCHSRFVGSSFGWLFTLEKPLALTLLNPFSGHLVPLPIFKDPLGEFKFWIDHLPDYFIWKGILLSDPFSSSHNYEVLVIYGGMRKLAFVRSGDDSWSFISTKRNFVFSDIISHKGQVLGVGIWSELVHIDLVGGGVKVMIKGSTAFSNATFLVESQEGDLLLVQIFWKYVEDDDEEDKNNFHTKTLKFKVFKLVHSIEKEEATWIQIHSLGDQALFLGDNHSVCVSTLEFPRCQPNCIYYSDYVPTGSPPYAGDRLGDDSGVFNLEDGSFQSHYASNPSENHMLPPIWFVPNLKVA